MSVVGLVGIVSAIAYPSYQEQMRKGRRAEGKTALLMGAKKMERYFTNNNSYPRDLASAGIAAFSGEKSTKSAYTIDLPTTTATTFILRAMPVASDPKCGDLTIDNSGVTGFTGPGPNCW